MPCVVSRKEWKGKKNEILFMLRITFTESRNNAKYISIESIKKDEYRRNNQHITTKSIRVDRVIKN